MTDINAFLRWIYFKEYHTHTYTTSKVQSHNVVTFLLHLYAIFTFVCQEVKTVYPCMLTNLLIGKLISFPQNEQINYTNKASLLFVRKWVTNVYQLYKIKFTVVKKIFLIWRLLFNCFGIHIHIKSLFMQNILSMHVNINIKCRNIEIKTLFAKISCRSYQSHQLRK